MCNERSGETQTKQPNGCNWPFSTDSLRPVTHPGISGSRPGRSQNSDVPNVCIPPPIISRLNHMAQYSQTYLDASFAALADATRRGVLEQLARGNASITDLADKFDMTLTGMKKHVGVLEQAGLVTTEKVGRVRNCKIGPYRLEEEIEWIS